MEENITIKKLEIENILRIDNIIIEPNVSEGAIVISGENEQGKSSLLNSIFLALLDADAKSELGIKEIIKTGNKDGYIKIELSNGIVVERFYNELDGMKLKVFANGEQVTKAPQKFINEIINKISIDPSTFLAMNNEERVKAFVRLTDYDIVGHNQQYKKLFEERLDLGREKRFYEKKVEELECEKSEEVSLDEIQKQISDATKHNNLIEQHKLAVIEIQKTRPLLEKAFEVEKELNSIVISKESNINDIGLMYEFKTLIESVHNRKNSFSNSLEKKEKELLPAGSNLEPIDISQLELNLKEFLEANSKAQAYIDYQEAINTLNKFTSSWDEKNNQIKHLNNMLVKAIEGLGLTGVTLEYNDKGYFPALYLNDIPFEQCSESEKIMFGLRLACMSSKNLKVIRISDASLFDENKIAKIVDIAKNLGFQIWLERVGYGFVTMSEGKLTAKEYENNFSIKDGKIVSK